MSTIFPREEKAEQIFDEILKNPHACERLKDTFFEAIPSAEESEGAGTDIPAIVQDRSNVLQWFTEDGTTVSVRPSGTEPKIKFYFGVKAPLASVADFDEVQAELDAKIEGIKRDLKLE